MMLQARGAAEKTAPLLERLVPEIRAALCVRDDDSVFTASCEALQQLSAVVGPRLNDYLAHLLVQINRRCTLASRPVKGVIHDTLCAISHHGGAEAHMMIKAKVPTFTC